MSLKSSYWDDASEFRKATTTTLSEWIKSPKVSALSSVMAGWLSLNA